MRFDAHVEVRALDGIADPAGLTIERALPALGFEGVEGVRVGKAITFSLEATDETAARSTVTALCDRLLANPVIEKAEFRLESAGA
jgi:phosphoribosylformylglycinamidine synthase subunit PurS